MRRVCTQPLRPVSSQQTQAESARARARQPPRVYAPRAYVNARRRPCKPSCLVLGVKHSPLHTSLRRVAIRSPHRRPCAISALCVQSQYPQNEH